MKSILHFPYSFVLMNWAAVVGFYCFVRGGRTVGQDIWTMPFHSHNHSAPHYSGKDAPLWAATR